MTFWYNMQRQSYAKDEVLSLISGMQAVICWSQLILASKSGSSFFREFWEPIIKHNHY